LYRRAVRCGKRQLEEAASEIRRNVLFARAGRISLRRRDGHGGLASPDRVNRIRPAAAFEFPNVAREISRSTTSARRVAIAALHNTTTWDRLDSLARCRLIQADGLIAGDAEFHVGPGHRLSPCWRVVKQRNNPQ
jgi:hypothetical protein